MNAQRVMVQGTTSSAGKSLLVTALCRIYERRGLSVAPFKSQNMSLNSFVTPDGHEIGRAQAVQAEAARVPPSVDMNPILLKPEGDSRSQVVVMGRPTESMTAVEYHERKPQLRRVIAQCLNRLADQHDVIAIEGAGSPAEINLRERDIVNMHVARAADSPVIIIGDIDRGGVFAAFVGTVALLPPEDRARVAGFVVNRFRGDVRLLEPGLDELTERTGIPVLGVIPYVHHLRIADEDSLALDARRGRERPGSDQLDIVVIRLPRLSNFDDVLALEHEAGVTVRFIDNSEQAEGADLVVIPGSKSTLADLAWLRTAGFDVVIQQRAENNEPVLGICGGCQMLGLQLDDSQGFDGDAGLADGLGVLPIRTRFTAGKTTSQVRAEVATASFLGPVGSAISGYEVHCGDVTRANPASTSSTFRLVHRHGDVSDVDDGAVNGSVVGTMVHGLFNDSAVRTAMLEALRARRQLAPVTEGAPSEFSNDIDRWADIVHASLDMDALDAIVGLEAKTR